MRYVDPKILESGTGCALGGSYGEKVSQRVGIRWADGQTGFRHAVLP